jgi:oligopeptide/dipeptide ABC transporter ATP-binding protein
MAYLFIAHDLPLVRLVADRIAVMYLGTIVEAGPREDVYGHPRHPYTEALLSAVPVTDPRLRGMRSRTILRGDPPSPLHLPTGCRFRTRCPLAQERCAAEEPALDASSTSSHLTACHFPLQGQAQATSAAQAMGSEQ